jgi:peptidoglycan/xylan/chitin deacetylase (PgdA/CDA1 family)
VLETIGAHRLVYGDDLPYRPDAWEKVERGELPAGDEVAEAFFHLARVEESRGPRDAHGRFPASATALDLLDPPLERLRTRLGVEPPRWAGARFAVALTHDVDVPWRWSRGAVKGTAARIKRHALSREGGETVREARGLLTRPLHRLRGTDPNWSFERVLEIERSSGAGSTFFVMAGHRHPADGPSPETYARLRPKLVETLLRGGAEVGLHGSYTAAEDTGRLAEEKRVLEELAGPVVGQRYHYLRVDPARNLAPLEQAGFSYDSSLGFAGALGFRAGIAHPFRPWDLEADRPLDLIEIPLAAMDVTFDRRYLALSARKAEPHFIALLEQAAARGGGFAVLWHTDRFDRWTAAGWDRLYKRLIERVGELGGVCMSAAELAEDAGRATSITTV